MTDEEVSKYWIVVTESGASWIGIPKNEPVAGCDVNLFGFALRVQEVRDQRGQPLGFERRIWPIEMVGGHQSRPILFVEVIAAAVQAVRNLEPPARAELARMIDAAETMRSAASAGLVLAGS